MPKAYVIIPFFNNEKLTALQDYLKQRFAGGKSYEYIQWQDPATFHVTLCYHSDIEDAELEQAVIKGFQQFEITAHRENHNGIDVFFTEDGRALYANIAESEELRALQAAVYAAFPEIGLSTFSNPDEWIPHITMAYLPDDFEIPPSDYDPIPLSVSEVSYNRDDYTPFATVSASQRNRQMTNKRKIPTSTHIFPALRAAAEMFYETMLQIAADPGKKINLIPREGMKQFLRQQRASYDFWMLYDMAWEWLESRYAYPFIEGGYIDGDGRIYMEFTDNGKLYRLPVLMVNGQVTFGEAEQIVIERVPVNQNGMARIVRVQRVGNKLRGVAIANTAVINRIGLIDSTELYDQMENRFEEFLATNPSEDQLPYLDIRHFNSRFGTDAFTMGRIHKIWRYKHQLHIAFEIDLNTELGRVAEQRIADGTWGISIEFLALNAREEKIGNVPILIYTDGKFLAASVLEERDAASYFTFIEAQETYRMAKTDEQLKQTVGAWLGDDAAADAFLESAQLPERQIEREGLIARDIPQPSDQNPDEPEVEDAPDEGDAPNSDEAGDDEELVLDDVALEALTERVTARIEQAFAPIRERLDALEESIRSAATGSQAAVDEIRGLLGEMNTDIEALQREDNERLNEIINDQSREQRRKQTAARQQRIKTVTYRPSGEREATKGDELPETPQPDKPEQKEGFGGAMRVKGGNKPANADTSKDVAVTGFGGAATKRKTN